VKQVFLLILVIGVLLLGGCTAPAPEQVYQQYFEQGNIYLEQEQWDKAVTEFSKAIELKPEFADAYANRAVAYLERFEDSKAGDCEYKKVIADCEKAVELNPIIKLNPKLALAYAHLGDCYLKYHSDFEKYEKAVANYTRAIEIDPDEADYYWCRGGVYSQLADYYGDAGLFSKVVDSNNKAIADFTKVIELVPERAGAYFVRGQCYAGNGDYIRAITDFTKAIELGREEWSVYFNRASAYKELGSKDEAVADYRKALALAEDDFIKEQSLKAIEELQAKTEASVIRVIDGDTIEVDIDGALYKVRYIGIDTPEVGQLYADEATKKNRELVEGKVVWLEKDVSETDKYNRLLRYVYVEYTHKASDSGSDISELLRKYGTSLEETRKLLGELSGAWNKGAEIQSEYIFVNAELMRLGYAQVATYPPDVKYQDLFVQLQREAREAGRGCWYTPEAPPITPKKTGEYVGSINSDVYHYPDCRYAQRIKPENEIWFTSVADAKAHGYRACKVCNPPGSEQAKDPWEELGEKIRFAEWLEKLLK